MQGSRQGNQGVTNGDDVGFRRIDADDVNKPAVATRSLCKSKSQS